MADHRSAKKRIRQNIVRNARNTAIRSRMRKAIRQAREAITQKSAEKDGLIKAAVREVYRASSRSVIEATTASRYASRLMRARSS